MLEQKDLGISMQELEDASKLLPGVNDVKYGAILEPNHIRDVLLVLSVHNVSIDDVNLNIRNDFPILYEFIGLNNASYRSGFPGEMLPVVLSQCLRIEVVFDAFEDSLLLLTELEDCLGLNLAALVQLLFQKSEPAELTLSISAPTDTSLGRFNTALNASVILKLSHHNL